MCLKGWCGEVWKTHLWVGQPFKLRLTSQSHYKSEWERGILLSSSCFYLFDLNKTKPSFETKDELMGKKCPDATEHVTPACVRRESFWLLRNVAGSESDSMQSSFNWLSSHTWLIHPALYVLSIKLGKRWDIPFSILHMQSSKQKSFEGRRSFVSKAKPLFSWQIIAGLAHFPAER